MPFFLCRVVIARALRPHCRLTFYYAIVAPFENKYIVYFPNSMCFTCAFFNKIHTCSFQSVGLVKHRRRNIHNLASCCFKQIKHVCTIPYLVLRFTWSTLTEGKKCSTTFRLCLSLLRITEYGAIGTWSFIVVDLGRRRQFYFPHSIY